MCSNIWYLFSFDSTFHSLKFTLKKKKILAYTRKIFGIWWFDSVWYVNSAEIKFWNCLQVSFFSLIHVHQVNRTHDLFVSEWIFFFFYIHFYFYFFNFKFELPLLYSNISMIFRLNELLDVIIRSNHKSGKVENILFFWTHFCAKKIFFVYSCWTFTVILLFKCRMQCLFYLSQNFTFLILVVFFYFFPFYRNSIDNKRRQ